MNRRNCFAILLAMVFLSFQFVGCSSTPKLVISGSLASSGSTGAAYTGTLTGAGGTQPYTWTATGLPPGLALSGATTTTLTVSGTPTTAGTYAVVVTLTDSKSRTATYDVSIDIAGGAALVITPTSLGALVNGTPLPNPIAVSFTPATTGPYTWTVTQGALPTGLVLNNGTVTSSTTLTSTGTSITITGTPTATGPYSFSLSVTDSATPQGSGLQAYSGIVSGSAAATVCSPTTSARGNEGALTLPFAFLAQGSDINGEPIAWAGSFTPAGTFPTTGNAGITAADVDFLGLALGPQHFTVDLTSSFYTYGVDGRGCLYLAFTTTSADNARSTAKRRTPGAKHSSLRNLAKSKATPQQSSLPAWVLYSFSVSQGYTTGRIEEFDYATTGAAAAGSMYQQTATDFAVSSLAPSFAFGLQGWYVTDSSGDSIRAGVAGNFTNTAGTLAGTADAIVTAQPPTGELSGGNGALNSASTTTGRGTGSYTITANGDTYIAFTFTYYIVNAGDVFILSNNASSNGTPQSFLLSGRALQSSTTSGVFNGYYLTATNGWDADNIGNYVSIGTVQATSTATGGTISTATFYSNDAGITATTPYTNATFSTTSTTGGQRIAFTGLGSAPPIAYLTSSSPDDGIVAFLVGTDSFATTGISVLQGTAAPSFSATSVQGSYANGTAEDPEASNGSEVGTFNFPGNSTYTGTIDTVTTTGENAGQQAAVPVSGAITINTDGSGNFDDSSKLLVTNGPLILAIDNNGDNTQPLLYIFINQAAASN